MITDTSDSISGCLLEPILIPYTIQTTSFGLLLVAFCDDKVALLNQGESEADLLAILESQFPAWCFLHQKITDSDALSSGPIGKHLHDIMEVIQRPISASLS